MHDNKTTMETRLNNATVLHVHSFAAFSTNSRGGQELIN